MTDYAALLAQAVDQANSVIAAIPAGKAHAATPCTYDRIAGWMGRDPAW